jgi:hypothetical protein
MAPAMTTPELVTILVIFGLPLLATAVAGMMMQRRGRKAPVQAAITVGNVVVIALGPLVCSLLLIQRDLLPLWVGAITMAGFVPAATSLILWYVLSHEDTRNPIKVNALTFTFLNIVVPTSLALFQSRGQGPSWALFGVCSFDFLALALAATLVVLVGPLRHALMPPRDLALALLALGFTLAVFLAPALTFEQRWIASIVEIRDGFGLWLDLAPRYVGVLSYSAFLGRHLWSALLR